MSDLREQVERVLWNAPGGVPDVADAVCALFAERERELRARIEALPRHTPVELYGHGIEMRRRDLGGWVRRRDMLAAFDD